MKICTLSVHRGLIFNSAFPKKRIDLFQELLPGWLCLEENVVAAVE